MIRLSSGIALLALSTPVLAHHGFGRFDPSKTIEVQGTLTGLDFVNPHSYVYFDAMQPDGSSPQKLFDLSNSMGANWIEERITWGP